MKTPTRAKQEPASLARQVEEHKVRKATRKPVKRGGEQQEADTMTAIHSENVSDERPCEACREMFRSQALVIEGVELFRAKYCEACLSIREIADEEQRRRELEERRTKWIASEWARICPPRYAEAFDVETLITNIKKRGDEFSEEKLRERVAKVINWPHSERGIGLVGKSGFGKTRIMFQLMRRYIERGLQVGYINLAVFGREVGARFGQSATEANAWINKLCRLPVLFLDDVGKEKMTERVETELYGIIEMRSAHLLPVYFTANIRGDKLIEKMTTEDGEISERAGPIVRRLKEFCEPISI